MKLRVICACLVLIFLSCGESAPKPKQYAPVGVAADVDAVIEKRGSVLAPACKLVTLTDVANVLGRSENEILVRDSTPNEDDPLHSSCFFKWSEYDLPNAGILVEVLRNPAGDEYPTYVASYIQSKRLNGERSMDGDAVLFDEMTGLGDDGAYSTSLGKYYWRLGERVILSLSFNTTHTADEQYDIARRIGALMTTGYLTVE